MTLTSAAIPGHTAEVVARTLRDSGVHIREIDTPDTSHLAADLLQLVWGSSEPVTPANLLRAVQHSGGYVFAALDDHGVMLGVSVGLLAAEGLHSHITGVVPAGQRRGLGLALKHHQRAWALDHGIRTITWTCDPLVRRNVAFNLHALGATVTDYLPDYYGPMRDGLNQGDESDRLALRWDLESPRTLAAGIGRLPWLVSDAPVAVDESAQVHEVPAGGRRVQLPADIEAVRRTDPERARRWRFAVRDAVVRGLETGASVEGLTAEGALVVEVSS